MPFVIDTYALTTLADIKEHLNIPTLTITQDNILIRMINAASMMIEQFLDRKVLQRSYTEFYDGRSNDRFLLRQWPAVKPSELWVDSSSLFTDVLNKKGTNEYELEGDCGVLLLNGVRFPKGIRNIKVVYLGGFTTVPYIIAEACIGTVEFMYDMKSDRRIGVTSKSKNAETVTFISDLPPVIKTMLTPFQRFEFPSSAQGIQNG